ncbi:MAG: hypothetical protein JRJ87_23210 [Deltaproteobacteria bacterium]|nr:hypothetical protein [Deltaproteobacteria bacterium]
MLITWPMITSIGEQLADILPAEVMMTMVHASEHIILKRPIRPGNKLRINGRIEAVLAKYAGTLVVVRFEGRNTKDDSAVFTEYTGGMLRGIECADSGSKADTLPEIPSSQGYLEPLWKSEIEISPVAAHLYDGCTNIVFPIHTSKAIAKGIGLPDIILQGTATMALAVREIVNHEANRNPMNVIEVACRFSDIVVPGSTIVVELLARQDGNRGRHLNFRVINSMTKEAIKLGYMLLKSPK